MDDLLLTLPDRLAPQHTGLLVVDMQNDFCGSGGYIERAMKRDASPCGKVADRVGELVALARRASAPVVWLRANYDPAGLPASMRSRLVEQGITDGCCIPGSWGYDWYRVRPEPGEPVIDKRSYDGFVNTPLEESLRAKGIRTIVFAGVQTNICVEATLRHAHALGFYCVVAEDCVASHTLPAHEMTLSTVRFVLGDAAPLAKIAELWQGAASR
ncbi:MAG: cysteine hydrolase family protein [Stellaceae bacterium]